MTHPSHIYVVVNRRTGFIYGVTFCLERARLLIGVAYDTGHALQDDIVSMSQEPVLPSIKD